MEVGSALSQQDHSFRSSDQDQPKARTILLLEKDRGLRKIITLTLLHQGMTVYAASDPHGAQQILSVEMPDLFILALDNPGGTNGGLIDLYREHQRETAGAVLVTTTVRPTDAWRNRYQPDVVIYKPFDIRFLIRCILELFQSPISKQGRLHRSRAGQ